MAKATSCGVKKRHFNSNGDYHPFICGRLKGHTNKHECHCGCGHQWGTNKQGKNVRLSNKEKCIIAFVQGAQWWEFYKTKFTMWQSDRNLALAEATRRAKGGLLGIVPIVERIHRNRKEV